MNERRFKECVMPLHKSLYAYALTILRDENDAQDCIQEAFTRLWENRNRLENIGNIAAYATVTVRNIALTTVARSRYSISATGDDPPPEIADPDPSPAKRMEDKDNIHQIRRLMLELPENQQRVLTLSSVAGLSTVEIHEATGLSEDNVRVLISRARKRLRRLFSNT